MEKPECILVGTNGNIFSLMGKASATLKKNNMAKEAKEMQEKIFKGENVDYDMALNIIGEYVEIC